MIPYKQVYQLFSVSFARSKDLHRLLGIEEADWYSKSGIGWNWFGEKYQRSPTLPKKLELKDDPAAIWSGHLAIQVHEFRDPGAKLVPVDFRTSIIKMDCVLGSNSCNQFLENLLACKMIAF